MYNTYKYARTISFFFVRDDVSVICNLGLGGGGYVDREKTHFTWAGRAHVGSPRLSSFHSTRPADYQFGFRSQRCVCVCVCCGYVIVRLKFTGASGAQSLVASAQVLRFSTRFAIPPTLFLHPAYKLDRSEFHRICHSQKIVNRCIAIRSMTHIYIVYRLLITLYLKGIEFRSQSWKVNTRLIFFACFLLPSDLSINFPLITQIVFEIVHH